MSREATFRGMSSQERELIAKLLDVEFPGRDRLTEQLTYACVRKIDSNGSLEFSVSSERPAQVTRRIPVEAELSDSDGVTVHLLLHVVEGQLSELEVYREDSGRLQSQIMPERLSLLVL